MNDVTRIPSPMCPDWCRQDDELMPGWTNHRATLMVFGHEGWAAPTRVRLEFDTIDQDAAAALVREGLAVGSLSFTAPRIAVTLARRAEPNDDGLRMPAERLLSLRDATALRDGLNAALDALECFPRCSCGDLANSAGQCEECQRAAVRERRAERRGRLAVVPSGGVR